MKNFKKDPGKIRLAKKVDDIEKQENGYPVSCYCCWRYSAHHGCIPEQPDGQCG